ncbi:creatininase family protein [Herbiconiux sp. A18JL235]|uniref:Creatininase family protein n=1 Tax=Herbiconiux sp. A18JL235 TaxID=3152363 RepID=A0AB39BLY9_9MICO
MTLLRLAEASWTDVRDHVASGGTLAFLPFGALEQHGPHLPLSTDTLQCTAVAERLAEHYSALLLPPVSYGSTWDNAAFPGTVSLKPSTVSALCADIAQAVWSFGVTTLVIVNGDYGNRAPVHAAAAALAADGDVLVLDYPGLVEVGDAVKESPWAAPGLCHADELETSMVLALEPRLAAGALRSGLPRAARRLRHAADPLRHPLAERGVRRPARLDGGEGRDDHLVRGRSGDRGDRLSPRPGVSEPAGESPVCFSPRSGASRCPGRGRSGGGARGRATAPR